MQMISLLLLLTGKARPAARAAKLESRLSYILDMMLECSPLNNLCLLTGDLTTDLLFPVDAEHGLVCSTACLLDQLQPPWIS